jgi:hypothetical protein
MIDPTDTVHNAKNKDYESALVEWFCLEKSLPHWLMDQWSRQKLPISQHTVSKQHIQKQVSKKCRQLLSLGTKL